MTCEKKHLKLSFKDVQNYMPCLDVASIDCSILNKIKPGWFWSDHFWILICVFELFSYCFRLNYSLKINFIYVFGERDEKNQMNDRIKKLSRHFLISFKDGEPGSHLLLSYNICVKEVAWKDFIFFWANQLTSEPKWIFRKCTHIDFSILLL